eukprot:jgi/Chlat1/5692/Chrsp38S05541
MGGGVGAVFAAAAVAFRRALDAAGVRRLADPLALAVSGGADSMALALLASSMTTAPSSPPLLACVVDHALRPESAAEAATVAGWLQRKGLAHSVLRCEWPDGKPRCSRLQADARNQRYRLLVEECRQQGIATLLTAHHADDQAETVLMRLARASGIDGLAGMPAVATLSPRVRLVRPLLGFTKQQLMQVCRIANQEWVEDPTNANTAFYRSRVRAALQTPGFPVEELLQVQALCSYASHQFKELEEAVFQKAVQLQQDGSARVDIQALVQCDEYLSLRVLTALLHRISRRVYPPRQRAVQQLYQRLRHGWMQGAFVAGGCRVAPVPGTHGEVASITLDTHSPVSAIGLSTDGRIHHHSGIDYG